MVQYNKCDLRLLHKPGDRVFYSSPGSRHPIETYSTGTVSRVSERILFVEPDHKENESYLYRNTGLLRIPYIGAMRSVVKYTADNAKIVEELSAINQAVMTGIERAKQLNNELKGENANV